MHALAFRGCLTTAHVQRDPHGVNRAAPLTTLFLSPPMTPLDSACYGAQSKDDLNASRCVDLLLQYGASVNTPMRPLVLAAKAGAARCVRRLVLAGADPNTVNIEGLTPLFAATTFGAPAEIVQLLLEAGADPNAPCGDAWQKQLWLRGQRRSHPRTPLHMAAYNDRADAIRLLLDAGADPRGAVHWARQGAATDRLLEDMDAAAALHRALWPSLKQDLIEAVWHPARLQRQGYFEDIIMRQRSPSGEPTSGWTPDSRPCTST